MLAPVVQNQFNCGGQAFETFLSGLALSVGFRHFRAEGDEPFATPLDHGRVAVSHVRKLPADGRADNRKCCRTNFSPLARFCFFILTSAFCLRATAQNYSIDWSTIDGGGCTSTGGVYSVSGTIGQPDAGATMSGGSYSLDGGFWSLIAAVQTPGAPLLTVTHSGEDVIVSWPSPSADFVLQQNTDLSNTNGWSAYGGTINDDGTTKSVTITPPTGNWFYRLKK